MRLTKAQAQEIRVHLREGVLTQREIARMYHVHESRISRIKSAPEKAVIDWGEKVRLVLAGFLHFGVTAYKVAKNCAVVETTLYGLWRNLTQNARERTYNSLGYAATRLFPELDFKPDLQLHRLERIGATVKQAMGTACWVEYPKRTAWILEHGKTGIGA